MNNYNGFYLLISVFLAISTQLGGLGSKSQDRVISSLLGEGENI